MLSRILFFLLSVPAFLPATKIQHWSIRGYDFTRIQWFIVQAAGLIGWIFFSNQRTEVDYALASLLLSACLYQLKHIIPFTKLGTKQTHEGTTDLFNTFTVLTANVLQDNKNRTEFLDIINQANPDIILAMETDKAWDDTLEKLLDTYSHRVRQPQDNYYGMHLYSRLPLSDTTIEFLLQDTIPSIHTTVELPSGQKIRMIGVHPEPPSPTEKETAKERDAEMMLVAKEINKSEEPTIVCGDLNDVAWSRNNYLFKKTANLLDPRIGRGIYATFHAKYFFMRFPVDHLFHTHHFFTNKIQRLPSYGSDHFPILYQLTYNPDITTPIERSLTNGEKEEVDEKIQDGRAEV